MPHALLECQDLVMDPQALPPSDTARDLKVLGQFADAVQSDPRLAKTWLHDTLAGASLAAGQGSTDSSRSSRIIEATLRALLAKAHLVDPREAWAASAEVRLSTPFYRLKPEERAVLLVLHSGRWSYDRLSRVLGLAVPDLERLSWSARVKLAPVGKYPQAPERLGPRCPEYDPHRPWTQRFLDDEIATPADRLFLQSHLMACESCRRALSRCRDLYFWVEGEISKFGTPKVSDLQQILDQARVLEERSSRFSHSRGPWTLGESLKLFYRDKPDVWVVSALVAVWLGWLALEFLRMAGFTRL